MPCVCINRPFCSRIRLCVVPSRELAETICNVHAEAILPLPLPLATLIHLLVPVLAMLTDC